MRDRRSLWNNCNVRDETRDSNLMLNCINRRSQLEKIMYTYNNLHQLHPRFKDLAEKAFDSEDPLMLWNYENETLLNSQDVERLMSGQQMGPYSKSGPVQQYEMQLQDECCYNGTNLVNSIDASYQQVQQPMPSFKWTADQSQMLQGCNPPQYLTPPPDMPQLTPVPQMASAPYCVNPQMMVTPAIPVQSSPQMVPAIPSPTVVVPPGFIQMGVPVPFSAPNANMSYQPLIFDNAGNAYQKMVMTSTVLVPVATVNTVMTNSSSAGSTYSYCSEVGEDVQSANTQENFKEKNSMKETIPVVELDEEESDKKQENYSVNEFVFGYETPSSLVPVDKTETEACSVDSESIRVGSSSSVETPEPEADVTLTEPTKVIENEWKVVCNKKGSKVLRRQMMSQCYVVDAPKPNPASAQKYELVDDTSVLVDTKETTTPVQSPEKRKLTKKEKKLLAAAKAKELETDDVVLEAALKENKNNKTFVENCEPSVSIQSTSEKKKKRSKKNVIITSVSVSATPPLKVPPKLLHLVKTTLEKRADEIGKNGQCASDDPIHQEYMERVILFRKETSNFDSEDICKSVKEFIKRRIEAFREKKMPQSFSRITIYEVMFVNLLKPFLPELCYLMSLAESKDAKFEIYEEAFFNSF